MSPANIVCSLVISLSAPACSGVGMAEEELPAAEAVGPFGPQEGPLPYCRRLSRRFWLRSPVFFPFLFPGEARVRVGVAAPENGEAWA